MAELGLSPSTDDESDLPSPGSLLTRPRPSQANPTWNPRPQASTRNHSRTAAGSQAGPSRGTGAGGRLSGADAGGGELASAAGASSQAQLRRKSRSGVHGSAAGKGKGKAKEVDVVELSDTDDDASTSTSRVSSLLPPILPNPNLDSDSATYDDLASPDPRSTVSPTTTSQRLPARAWQTQHASQAGSSMNRLPPKDSHERNRAVAASSSPSKASICAFNSESAPRAAAHPAIVPYSGSPGKTPITATSTSGSMPCHSRPPGLIAESTPRASIGAHFTVDSDGDGKSDAAMVESQLLPTRGAGRRDKSKGKGRETEKGSNTPWSLPQLTKPTGEPSPRPRPSPPLHVSSGSPSDSPFRSASASASLPKHDSALYPARFHSQFLPCAVSAPSPRRRHESFGTASPGPESDDEMQIISYNGMSGPPPRTTQVQRTSSDEQDAARRSKERKVENAEKKAREEKEVKSRQKVAEWAKDEEQEQAELRGQGSARAEDKEGQLFHRALEREEEDTQEEAIPELGFPRDDRADQSSRREDSPGASSIEILDNALSSISAAGVPQRPVEDVGADAEGDFPMAELSDEDEVGGGGLARESGRDGRGGFAGELEEEGNLDVDQNKEGEGSRQLYISPSKLKLQGRRCQVVPDSEDEDEQLPGYFLKDDASAALPHPQPVAPLSAAKLSPLPTKHRAVPTVRKSTQGGVIRPRPLTSTSLSLDSSVRSSVDSIAQSPALQSRASLESSYAEFTVEQSSSQSTAVQSLGSHSPAPQGQPKRRQTARKSTQGGLSFHPRSSVPSGPGFVLPSPEPLSVDQLGPGLGRKRAVKEAEQKGENENRRKRLRSKRASDDQLGTSTSGSSTPKQSAEEEEGRAIAAWSKLKRKSVGMHVDKPARQTQEAQTQASQVQVEPPLVLNANATVAEEPDEATKEQQRIREAKFKIGQQLTRPCYRHIAGPSYDLHDEIDISTQKHVARRERRWKRIHPPSCQPERKSYRALYEQMVFEANAREFPRDRIPSIRIIRETDDEPTPSPTEWWSPPFELGYTNRVIYADGIVPDQAPGCACVGNCGDPANRDRCACRARQIAASRTRPSGGERSGHQDFAYDENGIVNEKVLEAQDPIIECNSECGCGPRCINRVVGQRKSISVDIYWTGVKGWAVRNPKTRSSYTQRTIKKGEPLGVYAGELLPSAIADGRDDLVYHYIGRCYTYALDSWTIGEDYKRLAPLADADKIDVASHTAAHKSGPTTKRKTKKGGWSESGKDKDKGKGKGKAVEEKSDEEENGEETVYTSLYSIDAFSYGNWTRFANHLCDGFNVVPRPVYVDEANVTRPLWVYVARKDIK
ncbi:hypothetical protein JCM21900_004441, partial [Sporobolomyces salmonicolor]